MKFWWPRFFSASIATWISFLARSAPLLVLPLILAAQQDPLGVAVWLFLVTLQGMQFLIMSSIGLAVVRAYAYALGGADTLSAKNFLAGTVQERATDDPSMAPNLTLFMQIWHSAFFMFLAVVFLTAGMFTGLVWLSLPDLLADAPELRRHELLLSAAIFLAGVLLKSYDMRHLSYMFGVDRISMIRLWEAAFYLASFLSTAVVALSGASFITIVIVYQIPLVANVIWNSILVRRDMAARVTESVQGTNDGAVLRQLWPVIWRWSIGIVVYQVSVQGAALLYAGNGTVSEYATLLFALSLLRPMMQFSQVPFTTKIPTLSRMQAEGARDAMVRVALRGMRMSSVVLSVTGLAGLAYFVAAPRLFPDVPQVPPELWIAFCIVGHLEKLGSMHLQLYSTTSHVITHWLNAGTGALHILFVTALVGALGLYAFPLAQGLALTVFFVPLSLRYSMREYRLTLLQAVLQSQWLALAIFFVPVALVMLITS